jgi:hypothetical protein
MQRKGFLPYVKELEYGMMMMIIDAVRPRVIFENVTEG